MYRLTAIAETGDRFNDFAPYVAAIDASGLVTFQATLPGGGTGVFRGSGGPVAAIVETSADELVSHPDVDGTDAACVYTRSAVVLFEDGRTVRLADTSGPFARIGPLGPTMNDAGMVAFRADLRSGLSGVFLWRGGEITTIADTGTFAGFQGLPVVGGGGSVVFRADLEGGGHGIYASRDGALETIARTGTRFRDLGLFPCANAAGTVVFSATLEDGSSGIFAAAGGEIATVVDSSAGFESFRGALVDDAEDLFFYATPKGGRLGVYGRDEAIVSIGDPIQGSAIVELALNPVSVAAGRLAIRLRLASGGQLVVRADRGG